MNKVIAVYLGPSGLALLGQFQNFVTVASGMSNASIQTGLVKYTAEFSSSDQAMLKKTLKNALMISLFSSLFLAIIVFLFSNVLSVRLMYSTHYNYIFDVFAISLIFYSLNYYVLSVINGLGAIGLYVLLNIITSIITLILSVSLTIYMGLHGALLAIILAQSLIFSFSFLLTVKRYPSLYKFSHFWSGFDFKMVRRLMHYGLATFSSAVMTSLAALVIRHVVVITLSLESAGLWEAAWRIAFYFNLVFFLPFSIYYLPKLSAAKMNKKIRGYFVQSCLFLLPLMILSAVFLCYFRVPIISLLFSSKFILLGVLLPFITAAEVFRLLAMMLIDLMLARANVSRTVISAIGYNVLLIMLSYFSVKYFGFIGLGYAYFCAAVVWLLFNLGLCFFVRKAKCV